MLLMMNQLSENQSIDTKEVVNPTSPSKILFNKTIVPFFSKESNSNQSKLKTIGSTNYFDISPSTSDISQGVNSISTHLTHEDNVTRFVISKQYSNGDKVSTILSDDPSDPELSIKTFTVHNHKLGVHSVSAISARGNYNGFDDFKSSKLSKRNAQENLKAEILINEIVDRLKGERREKTGEQYQKIQRLTKSHDNDNDDADKVLERIA